METPHLELNAPRSREDVFKEKKENMKGEKNEKLPWACFRVVLLLCDLV